MAVSGIISGETPVNFATRAPLSRTEADELIALASDPVFQESLSGRPGRLGNRALFAERGRLLRERFPAAFEAIEGTRTGGSIIPGVNVGLDFPLAVFQGRAIPSGGELANRIFGIGGARLADQGLGFSLLGPGRGGLQTQVTTPEEAGPFPFIPAQRQEDRPDIGPQIEGSRAGFFDTLSRLRGEVPEERSLERRRRGRRETILASELGGTTVLGG